MTCAETAGEGRQVITRSTPAASSLGEFAGFAPRATNDATRSGSRSRTVSSISWRSRLAADIPQADEADAQVTHVNDSIRAHTHATGRARAAGTSRDGVRCRGRRGVRSGRFTWLGLRW